MPAAGSPPMSAVSDAFPPSGELKMENGEWKIMAAERVVSKIRAYHSCHFPFSILNFSFAPKGGGCAGNSANICGRSSSQSLKRRAVRRRRAALRPSVFLHTAGMPVLSGAETPSMSAVSDTFPPAGELKMENGELKIMVTEGASPSFGGKWQMENGKL
jgi:hypothetical protein